jgi:DNA-binding Lrp family transcriptional regulator
LKNLSVGLDIFAIREYRISMIAKSLDVVVLLKLLLEKGRKPYAQLSEELGISASEIHAAVARGVRAGLISPESRVPLRKPLAEYLLHGVRYAFPASPGSVARGIPTAYAAPPLSEQMSPEDLPPVWSDPEGSVRGVAVEPLHPAVPHAAKADAALYALLALVDTLRVGKARERKLAEAELIHRLHHAHVA